MTSETAIYLRLKGALVRVDGRSAVLGRSEQCDVHVDDGNVSRRHCEIFLHGDGVLVRDLDSRHGTRLDGRELRGEARASRGSVIQLGAKGPRVEIMGAMVDGQSLLGSVVGAKGAAATVGAGPTGPNPPLAASPTSPPGFVAGLLWGAVTGVLLGVAALLLVEV